MKLLISTLLLVAASSVMADSFCISHKGSYKSAPENSLQSLQAALDLNADGVEFDIQHTKDGRAIVMHDPKLNTATHLPGRICPLKTKIKDLLLKDIRENCAVEFNKQFLPVPLLEEALEVVADSGKLVFVELKDEPSASTEETIHHFFQGHSENLRIIAFRPKNIDHLRKMNAKNQNFWKDVKGLDLDITPWGADPKYGTNIWNKVFSLRSAHHRRIGIETSVWTLNDEASIKKFFSKDVTFITTNEIEICQRLKSERLTTAK
jgi:glycerophosphoryl diester phosphodiesterase